MEKKQIVILAHGLVRSKLSMVLLARHLRKHGFTCRLFSYRSTRHPVKVLAAKFATFIRETAEGNPGCEINFVTHSLGGILMREALRQFEGTPRLFGRAVMLAPPNRGSAAASFFSRFWPLPELLRPLSELSDREDSTAVNAWQPRCIEIGVIAGRFDKKVSLEESHLECEKEHAVVNSFHTFIMENPETKKLTVNFLRHGTFGLQSK